MVIKVPSYTSNVSARARGTTMHRLNINAKQFGSDIGAGLKDLAGGIQDAADAVDARMQIEAEAEAREAMLSYREQVRQGLYNPETGYLNQTGGNAMGEARANTHANLTSARGGIADGLSKRARKIFDRSADALDVSTQDTTIRHEGVQFKNFTLDTFQASAQGYLDEALLHSGNEGKFNMNLDAAEAELRRAGSLAGRPPEQIQLDVDRMRSSGHAGRVTELARQSPIVAMQYLEENKDKISNDHYTSLKDGLEGAYYAEGARTWVDERGGTDAQADPNVPVGDWLRYNNQGATRNQKLSPELVDNLSVLEDMGLGFEVFSGGQDGIETGSQNRVGSTRHDHGHAADGFITKNGKRLSWANPGERAVIVEAVKALRAAGVTGIGAGPGYMQEGSLHIGFGNEAVWGADGQSANAPDWLVEAWNSAETADGAPSGVPASQVGVTLTEALEIDNPQLREAVVREIETRRRAAANDRAHRRGIASDRAWDIIDQGGRPEDIPPEVQAEAGMSVMNTIFDTYERNVQGIDTNDELREQELRDLAVEDPNRFAGMDLNEERATLSRGVYAEMKEMQRAMLEDRKTIQEQGVSAVVYKDEDYRAAQRDAKDQYTAAIGVAPGAKMSPEQVHQYNRFTQQLREGMRQFANENGRAMTFEERTNYTTMLLAPVVIEGVDRSFGPGVGDQFLFEAPSLARNGADVELQYGRDDVPPDVEMEITQQLTRQFGREPTEGEVVEQYENEVLLSMGIPPNIEANEIPKDIRRNIQFTYPGSSPEEVVDIYRNMVLVAANRSGLR